MKTFAHIHTLKLISFVSKEYSSYKNKCTKIYIYKENRYVDIIIPEGIYLSFLPLNLQMPRVQQ